MANVLRFLLSRGARINLADAKSSVPLYFAAREGHLEVCKMLVAKGADVNQKTFGFSPWLLACSKGHLDIVKLFVDNGQDIEFADNDGDTGLMVASREGKANVARFLLSKCARTD